MLLESLDGDRTIECHGNTFVGRGLITGLDIDDREVSSLHAVIAWHPGQGCWLVHDLGSQNGTRLTVGGGSRTEQKVTPGRPARLAAGMGVFFAGHGFTVLDAEGPPASALCLSTGELRLASDGVLLLPDEQRPELMLVQTGAGWVCRRPEEAAALAAGDGMDDAKAAADEPAVVQAGGRSWRLWRPISSIQTARQTHSALRIAYEIIVSPTGDDVRLVLKGADGTITLPSRRHHELVWLLARARHEDAALPASERGWRDPEVLLGQMALRESGVGYISVLTHRLRNQLKGRKLADADAVIERREGMLRLAVADVSIRDLGREDRGSADVMRE
ncbi:MAG: FHA domain-containing protein [bacterium]|nr:FHA domain-containing protein [Myxococcales bacterium]MCB9543089.1 FHA domain-containing protein [Myxococcales bacterium]MCB9551623.1 FHA domain-containing protein [Myxococcales bacterium]